MSNKKRSDKCKQVISKRKSNVACRLMEERALILFPCFKYTSAMWQRYVQVL
ncbi:MAG TPA: hypothetical protein VIK89_13025 [Cytophagaceae bacterium]